MGWKAMILSYAANKISCPVRPVDNYIILHKISLQQLLQYKNSISLL